MEKRPNTDDTLVDDDGVVEPWITDDESLYSQEQSVITASLSTPIGSSLVI